MSIAPESRAAVYAAAKRKAIVRLMPLLLLAYFIANINRTNVSIAKQNLEIHAGIDAAAFGLGAGLFFVTYAIFEIPSNMVLRRVGARIWIARIAVSWGIISVALMFTTGPVYFYIVRMLLGAAEAGIFPAILYLITRWFAQEDRGKMSGVVLATAALSSVVAAPAGGALLSLEGLFGLHGYQMLFLLEGVPAIIIGIIIFFTLPSGPEDAGWLTESEREVVLDIAGGEQSTHETIGGILRAALANPLIVIAAVFYVFNMLAAYGIIFFTPSIIFAMGVENTFHVGLIAAIVSIGSAAGLLIVPRFIPRAGGEMRLLWCTTGATIVTAALFLASAAGVGLPSSHALQIGILALVMFFVSASQPLLWSSLMARITGAVAATGLAFVSMFGQIGSFIGPYAFGLVEKNTGDANASVWLILAATVCGLALLPLLARVLGRAAGPTSSSGGKERFGDGDVTP
ncbi:MAG TPA: MFS transporter [Dietzia timorensis]|uniref:MFS transporter n=1 Tax=Dietzia timorensis TaxID=499555 RepID=A0A921F5A7_9ACTN|nr:MFS transporter [Dietzia timorensis]HJE90374.1 MFS transporter [Dietzia timorensis]